MSIRPLSTAVRALRSAAPVPLYSMRAPPKLPSEGTAPLPPVLMVHGVLASASTYRSIMTRPDFVPHREVIGIDLRNHGQSPHLNPADGMRYEDMAADISSFLETEGIEKACIIGHSMGGKVAMQLALSEPGKVSELIVVDISPISYVLGKEYGDAYVATRAMRAISLEKMETRAEVDAALFENGVNSKAVRQFAMTNLTASANPDSKYQWRLNLAAIEEAFPSIVTFPEHSDRSYKGPTCLIRGGKSNYVPFQSMRVFTSLFPNSKLVTISEAGHWLQAQAPDDFCTAVNDFLDK